MVEDFDYDVKHYDYLFRIWLVNNENYWKRIQILMLGIQTALFFGFLSIIKDSDHPKPWATPLISLAGMGFALYWRCAALKAIHYLEFYRRSMRDLEAKMTYRINCFTLEGKVFGPAKQQYRFKYSGEQYPEDKGLHRCSKVKGGLAPMERNLSLIFFGWWVAVFVVMVLNPLELNLPSLLKRLLNLLVINLPW